MRGTPRLAGLVEACLQLCTIYFWYYECLTSSVLGHLSVLGHFGRRTYCNPLVMWQIMECRARFPVVEALWWAAFAVRYKMFLNKPSTSFELTSARLPLLKSPADCVTVVEVPFFHCGSVPCCVPCVRDGNCLICRMRN